MISVDALKHRTAKDLAEMAKRKKVPGWHAMRKEELVRALVRVAKAAARRAQAAPAKKPHGRNGSTNGKAVNGRATNGKSPAAHRHSAKPQTAAVRRRLQKVRERQTASKDLTFRVVGPGNGHAKDRLVVMVRDPYWLHVYWELSRRTIERAQAAMGQHWHGAKPVLRVHEVDRNGTTSTARRFVRDIDIHGGVNNWYVDVQNPPKSYQLDVGYRAADGGFYCLAKSNVVTTPPASAGDAFDQNWAEVAKDFDRIYAMSGGYESPEGSSDLKEVFEERLRRPVGDSLTSRFGVGAASGDRRKPFNFQLDTELIVHGVTEPDAHVTLRGEPVPVRPDGSFAVRFNLPDRRHVLPVVASSRDGGEQRTIVLAVDRNTKVMEPVIRDAGE